MAWQLRTRACRFCRVSEVTSQRQLATVYNSSWEGEGGNPMHLALVGTELKCPRVL